MRPALSEKSFPLVRVSGRMTVAQQFTAGISGSQTVESVKRTTDKSLEIDNLSRPFHGLANDITSLPSDESLGYYHSSATADWEFGLFGQSS